jgi:hypothetical protein
MGEVHVVMTSLGSYTVHVGHGECMATTPAEAISNEGSTRSQSASS